MNNFLDQIPVMVFSYVGGGIFLLLILYKFFPKIFLSFHKPFFFTIGVLSLSLGYVGIVVPGLPTTVFILIAAWAFSKCSERFTVWLESHKIFGPIILKNVNSIAMVGASATWNRPSNFVMKYLLQKGYKVIPVNPSTKEKEICGEKVFGDLATIEII